MRTTKIMMSVGAVVLAVGALADRTPDFARTLTLNLGMQGRVMWIDASANIDRITTLEGVRDIVARCKQARLTTLVIDVKPVSGQVLYPSELAERMRVWKGKAVPDFDVLGAFVEEGHKAGLEVTAAFNVFSEGHKHFSVGLAYRNLAWQSVAYVVDRALLASGGARLRIRSFDEPEDASRATVYADGYVQQASAKAGERVVVALDADRRVAGILDAALLGDEPMVAPDNGFLLSLQGGSMDWAGRYLRAGDRTQFEAVGRRIRGTDASSEKVAAFVSPLHPAARAYQISLMQEVARKYPVDGIVFDRMRFANLHNDFGDAARSAFERWLGKPVSRWPEDVVQFNRLPGEPIKRGRYFRQWLEFRARVIREFVRDATEAIRSVRPGVQFGAYVGSWFTEYYGVGVNWASEKFAVRTGWASDDYNEAGYCEFLDWLSTGCYYSVPTRAEAVANGTDDGGTVEAAAELSTAVVANATPIYAGLYALNYVGNPEGFSRAIETAARRSQGVMIFDLSYIYDYGWWSILERAFAQPSQPPHRALGITAQLRGAHDRVRNPLESNGAGSQLPLVPYQPGGG